jgi:tripartite-type tricarboxylate transporter receptor subunit TctC
VPLGSPVIVENKPGAGTRIGAAYVAKQPADGYTLLLGSITMALLPSLTANLPFDPVKDFTPIGTVVYTPFALVVNAESPIKTVHDYISAAKARPGNLTFGSSGIGSTFHFAGELMKAMASIDVLHIPYKGSAQIAQAIIAGEVTSTFSPLTPLMPQIRAGRVRPLAALGSKRMLLLPELPTMAEAAPLPGYAVEPWFGVFGPAGVPRAIVDRLNKEINQIVRDPQFVKEKLLPAGVEPLGGTPESLRELLESDIVKYAKIAKFANIKTLE